MSEKLPKNGTKRTNPKGPWPRLFYAVFSGVLLFACRMFCLWRTNAGRTDTTSFLENHSIVGGSSSRPLLKGSTLIFWRPSHLILTSILPFVEKTKSGLFPGKD